MSFASNVARALIPVTVLVAAAPAAANPASDLKQVEAHLAATSTLVANFTQTDGKGRQLNGTLQMKKPGKIRFEYGRGTNMLLVGNGKTLTFIDYDVGQKNNWAVSNSPLSVLMSPQPNLGRIARITDSGNPNVIVVRARDARRPEFGTLILAFVKSSGAPAGLRLDGWTAIDAQNKKTTVRLSGQRYNVAVADSAFTYAEPKKRR
jgi:chaperone LolA